MGKFKKAIKLLTNPKAFIKEETDERLEAIMDFMLMSPIGIYQSQDIFVAGYPKSGNTWVQNLLASIIYGIDARFLPDSLVHSLVSDVHYKKYYMRFLEQAFFKTHHLPRKEYKKVIYIIRDPRDVMASYFAMQKTLVPECNLKDMIIQGKHIFPCKWHVHVNAWMKNPYKAEILLLKYEDLKTDALKELMRICDFIGIQRPSDLLERAVKSNSIENMKIRENEFGMIGPIGVERRKGNKDAIFFRKGQVGSYKNEIPFELIQHMESEFSEEMNHYGYL